MDHYAVIGNPVKHSLSPFLYQAFALQTDQPLKYTAIEAPLKGFADAALEFLIQGGKGLNITAPFKQEAFLLATKRTEAAHTAQAASMLYLKKNQIIADNLDGFGLLRDLSHHYRVDLHQKKILIIGAGGATRGILGPLLNANPAQVVIANRTASKAYQLAQAFDKQGPVVGVDLNKIKAVPYDIIIHASSAGLQGKTLSLPSEFVGKESCCYDLSYGEAAKPFLQWAKKNNALKIFDGVGMLIEHNAAVFHQWRGVYPDSMPIRDKLSLLHGTPL